MQKSLCIISTLICLLFIAYGNASGQQSRPMTRVDASDRGVKKTASASFQVLVKDSVGFRKWMRNNLPHAGIKQQPSLPKVYRISGISVYDVAKLQSAPALEYAERSDRLPAPEGSVPGLDLSLNSVTTVHELYPSLTGTGLRVVIKENAFDKNDLDLRGRVVGVESFPASYDPHATAMATIISGAGNTSPASKGVAWRSYAGYSDFSNLMPEPTAGLVAEAISVGNHSYGVGVENFYGIEAHAYDKQCRDYPAIVHVFSSGNAGSETPEDGVYKGIAGYANITGQFKTSKNTISAAGVDAKGVIESLSSRGPAMDGRIKPEVAAYGNGGTSEAAAIVSGICLLMQHAYQSIHDSLPPSALVKAALINSSDDAGTPGVDHVYGFGIADARGAVEAVLEGRYFSGVVSHDSEVVHTITLPANVYRLKVTLAWSDPEAAPGTERALVNDLDLQMTHTATADTYKPWVLSSFPHADSLTKEARRDEDHLNNVEQITLTNPAEGNYSVVVRGFNLPDGVQDFYVAYEISSGLSWVYPRESDAVQRGKPLILRWNWDAPESRARAEWKISGTNEWVTIGEVQMANHYHEWIAPDVDDIVEVRFIADDEVLYEGSFVVSQQPDLSVGYNCERDALVFWNAGNAPAYQVYKIDDSFLEPGVVVQDTFLVIDKETETAEYLSVVPLVKERPGVRSRSLSYDTGSERCYIRSFLPRELVTDSVFLEVELGTNLGLASLALERQTAIGFETLATVSPVDDLLLTMFDSNPRPGRNHYRIRLDRTNGETVFSQIEEAWFSGDHHLLFFPNPAVAGESLSVIVNGDMTVFRIYDVAGNLIREFAEDGEIKNIDTEGLGSGLFFIRTNAPSGRTLTGKLILR